MKDLVLLVADKDMEHAVKGLLGRPEALGLCSGIVWDLFVHSGRDPGCLNRAHEFLRPLSALYHHAMVMFDRLGCGREKAGCEELAGMVMDRLSRNGWDDRAHVVVIDPELEVWAWSRSPHVAACLGWEGQTHALRSWLQEVGLWPAEQTKPPRPKEAMLAALRERRRPYSSSIYLELASRVSLQGHSETAFLQFVGALRAWFPSEQSPVS